MEKRFNFRTLDEYEMEDLGLPYPIKIINAAVERTDSLKNLKSVSIPDFEGLLAHFAFLRTMVPNKLLGSEARFLRRTLGVTAKEFATMLSVDAATVSRWENSKQTISESNERHLRLLVASKLAEKARVLASLYSPSMILQMALKASFKDGYKPAFVFVRERMVDLFPESWQIKQAA